MQRTLGRSISVDLSMLVYFEVTLDCVVDGVSEFGSLTKLAWYFFLLLDIDVLQVCCFVETEVYWYKGFLSVSDGAHTFHLVEDKINVGSRNSDLLTS